jgi:hypothetical protein
MLMLYVVNKFFYQSEIAILLLSYAMRVIWTKNLKKWADSKKYNSIPLYMIFIKD